MDPGVSNRSSHSPAYTITK